MISMWYQVIGLFLATSARALLLKADDLLISPIYNGVARSHDVILSPVVRDV